MEKEEEVWMRWRREEATIEEEIRRKEEREERRLAKETESRQLRREKEYDIEERITELLARSDVYDDYVWIRDRDERDDMEIYAILFGNTLDLCFQHEDRIDEVLSMSDEELKEIILQASRNIDVEFLEEQQE